MATGTCSMASAQRTPEWKALVGPRKATNDAFAEAALRRAGLRITNLVDVEDAQRLIDRWRASWRPHLKPEGLGISKS